MKKRFLKIASTAAAVSIALALGVNSAYATSTDEIVVNSTVDLSGDNAQLIIINQEYAEAYTKAFNEAMEDEWSKINIEQTSLLKQISLQDAECNYFLDDPHIAARERAEKRAQEECEKLGLYNAIELTPLENTAYYKGWTGTFEVDNISQTRLHFSTPETFSCSAGGNTGTMTAKTGYLGNSKYIDVTVTYSDGTTSHNYSPSNASSFSVSAPNQNKTIVRADYVFCMNSGTEQMSRNYELAYVTLVKKQS